jgi:hypothetical protein
LAKDQTHRGAVPEDRDPLEIRNVQTQEDYLAHRAEYLFHLFPSNSRYASPQPIPATLYHVTWLDHQDSPPYAQFRFIYRSKEVLMAKGIIPVPSPSPPPPPPSPTRAENDDPQGKKRKTKAEPKKKAPAKKTERAPRQTRKPKVVAPKVTPPISSDTTSSLAEVTPKTSTDSDAPPSPLVEALQRRKSIQQISSQITTPQESPAPLTTDQVNLEVLRELQHLRVCHI